ncbi:unnamed protein product [Hydatigera taeniaeformis]|uniref:Uncharacterized protein n=1 Tax=Hydatigena taeniaeformis TaxID=6205 RepID=A0A0R3WRL6_HYDTA|nr:unnamed protein product [Hydatigera taeniaeformis]
MRRSAVANNPKCKIHVVSADPLCSNFRPYLYNSEFRYAIKERGGGEEEEEKEGITEQVQVRLRLCLALGGEREGEEELTCLRLTEGLSLNTLASYATTLSQLTAAVLAFDDLEVEMEENAKACGSLIAPSYLLHLTDAPARLQFILSLVAHWLPRHLLRLASEQSHVECRQLLEVQFCFTFVSHPIASHTILE